MRFKTLSTTSDGGATVRITADSAEDMWYAYNIIELGDRITSVADRKIARDTAGGTSVERITVRLAVSVTDISFDPDTGSLRISGVNTTENAHVRLGAHHTLELEPHRSFDLEKRVFDSMHWEQLKEGRGGGETGGADIAAIVMDQGIAYICSIGAAMTVVRAKIETSVPKKRPGVSQHERGVTRFHEAVLAAMLRHVDWEKAKAVILASPRFVKDDFFAWMMEEASRRDLRPILDAKSRFVLTHASGGHPRALQGVFADRAVAVRLADTRAAQEVGALGEFFRALNTDPDRAFYGYRYVRLAADRGVVATLLVSDSLLRSHNPLARRLYVALVDDVRGAGGSVHVCSSMHPAGEQLAQIGGLAAVLRFAVPDAEEASAGYARIAGLHHHAAATAAAGGAAGGGEAGGGAGGRAASCGGGDYASDSDGSSDSDASYKRAA